MIRPKTFKPDIYDIAKKLFGSQVADALREKYKNKPIAFETQVIYLFIFTRNVSISEHAQFFKTKYAANFYTPERLAELSLVDFFPEIFANPKNQDKIDDIVNEFKTVVKIYRNDFAKILEKYEHHSEIKGERINGDIMDIKALCSTDNLQDVILCKNNGVFYCLNVHDIINDIKASRVPMNKHINEPISDIVVNNIKKRFFSGQDTFATEHILDEINDEYAKLLQAIERLLKHIPETHPDHAKIMEQYNQLRDQDNRDVAILKQLQNQIEQIKEYQEKTLAEKIMEPANVQELKYDIQELEKAKNKIQSRVKSVSAKQNLLDQVNTIYQDEMGIKPDVAQLNTATPPPAEHTADITQLVARELVKQQAQRGRAELNVKTPPAAKSTATISKFSPRELTKNNVIPVKREQVKAQVHTPVKALLRKEETQMTAHELIPQHVKRGGAKTKIATPVPELQAEIIKEMTARELIPQHVKRGGAKTNIAPTIPELQAIETSYLERELIPREAKRVMPIFSPINVGESPGEQFWTINPNIRYETGVKPILMPIMQECDNLTAQIRELIAENERLNKMNDGLNKNLRGVNKYKTFQRKYIDTLKMLNDAHHKLTQDQIFIKNTRIKQYCAQFPEACGPAVKNTNPDNYHAVEKINQFKNYLEYISLLIDKISRENKKICQGRVYDEKCITVYSLRDNELWTLDLNEMRSSAGIVHKAHMDSAIDENDAKRQVCIELEKQVKQLVNAKNELLEAINEKTHDIKTMDAKFERYKELYQHVRTKLKNQLAVGDIMPIKKLAKYCESDPAKCSDYLNANAFVRKDDAYVQKIKRYIEYLSIFMKNINDNVIQACKNNEPSANCLVLYKFKQEKDWNRELNRLK